MKSFGHYCLINDQRIVPTIEEANANQNNYIHNYKNSQDSQTSQDSQDSQASQDDSEFVDFDESTTIAQRSVIGTDLRNIRKEIAATKVPHEPVLHDFTLQKFFEFEASLELGMIIFI